MLARDFYINTDSNGHDSKFKKGKSVYDDYLHSFIIKYCFDKYLKKDVNILELGTYTGRITKKLEKSGYIEKIGYTEHYAFDSGKKLEPDQELEKSGKNFRIKIIENGTAKYEKWPLKIQKNDRESRYQVTALGKRISRDAYIFK